MKKPSRGRAPCPSSSCLANSRRLLLLACCLSGAASAADIALDVQHAPSRLPTPGGGVLVYELNVRNHDASACARLVDVRMQGGDARSALEQPAVAQPAVEQRYQGPMVAGNTLVYDAAMAVVRNPLPGQEQLHPTDIPPGGGAVVYFFVPLAAGTPAPATLRHRLDFMPCVDGANTRQTVVEESAVSGEAPVIVGLPFRGEGWVAGDSVNAKGTHRRTLIPVRDADGNPLTGQFHVPERYAIDWVVVDDQARRAIGAVDANASYLAFGKDIIAVADGVISHTRDGMPEQTPPHSPSGQTVATAAGNYIMQDIGGGHYAFYAHLQPGSLRVTEGDHVTRGQVIALLGNTGNTTEAHLHFHVSDADDPLMSEGVPFVFDRFRTTGQVDGMDEETGVFDDYVRQDAQPRYASMPPSFSVLSAEPIPPSPLSWGFPLNHCTP